MKPVVSGLAALGLVLGWATWAQAGPIVINGDFEAVQIGPPFVSHNVADVPGWTHSGSLGDGPLWAVGYADVDGSITVAGHGNQFVTMGAGFTSVPAFSSWDQVVAGFSIGSSYVLTFDMAAEANFSGPQSLTVDFPSGSSTGSQTFTAATPSANYWRDWEAKSMTFVATSTSVDLRFSAFTAYDVGLDNVNVTPASTVVPEPASLTLLGLGAAGLMGYGLRRRKQAAAV